MPGTPDDSIGKPSHDFSSFTYLTGALGYLESVVESADAAPTPDAYAAFAKLQTLLHDRLTRLAALERAVK